MAITYGFFNSKDGDRKYNAEQISQYFKGLVSAGVLAEVSDGLQVYANGGMRVLVKAGRAFDSKHHWMESNTEYILELEASSVTLNRIDRVIIRFDMSETKRNAEILIKKGTPATKPTAPILTRTAEIEEYSLAEIYIEKNIEEITQSVITDTRADTNVCGWVTGLIKQVDTSTLYAQWQDAYKNYYNDATAEFNEWFEFVKNLLDESTAARLQADVEDLQKNTIKGVKGNGTKITPDANNVVDITPSKIGAASSSHNHSATDITSGTLSVSRGGTGATSFTSGNILLGNGTGAISSTATLDITKGGTGATTASTALSNLGGVPTSRTINSKALSSNISLNASDVGAAESSHNHSATNITSGTLSVSRGGTGTTSLTSGNILLGNGTGAISSTATLDITKGGTGATTASTALSNLGGVPTSRTINSKALSSNISLNASDVGAAESSHNHSATNITSGILSVSRGGTGTMSLTSGNILLGNGTSAISTTATLALTKGGTGATSASAAANTLLFVSRPNTSTICSVVSSGSKVVDVADGWAIIASSLGTGNNWSAIITTWDGDASYHNHYVVASVAYSNSIWARFESNFNLSIRVSYVVFKIA